MPRLTVIATILTTTALAYADDPEPPMVEGQTILIQGAGPTVDQASASVTTVTRSYRSVPDGWLILPEGQELGAELRFVQARSGALSADELVFTDVAFLTLRARTVLGTRADLFAAVDVLPKQPSFTDELVWQGATLGVNAQPWDRPFALWARVSGGPMLDRTGYWGQAGLGIDARKVLHRIMTFEGGASTLVSALRPEADAMDRAWLVEAAVSGSVLFHDPEHWAGAWFGFAYSLPIVHRGVDPTTAMPLDPQPRLDVGLGVTLSFVDTWDVFVRGAVVDRGDLAAPATRLPILDGGFDQHQVVFGATWHSWSRERRGYGDD
jgi:hypothetical protein